jgi:hypothetical protein
MICGSQLASLIRGQLHHIKCSTKLKYKMAVRDAYTDFERRHDDELYFHFLHKRPTEFWKTWNAKFRRNINKNMVLDGCQTDEDIADKFATYFETIFQQPQVVDESTVQCEQLSTGNVSSAGRLTSSELCELISPELVEKCVSKIALGKACGPDNLSVEHVLYAHPSTIIALCRLFKLIILHKYVPTSFGAGTIVPLIKDKCGNLNDVSNYRPITLTPVLSKILEHVLFSLCEEFLITDELQFGFKRDLGCADAIFALRTTIEHFNSKGSTVFLAALDIKKAFDSVKHDKLFNSLRSSGVPALIVDLLRNWYGKLYVNIRYNNGFSYCFSVLNGVRQGGVLSPSLFTLFVDAFISNLRMLNIGCRIKTTFIGCLLYADDILLLSPSIRGLQSMLNMCSDTASHISLEFNANKSYCLAIGNLSKLNIEPMTLGGTKIAWATSVKYLGVTIKLGNSISFDIDAVKQSFFRACNCVYAHARNLDEIIHLSLQESYCLPVLTYVTAALKYTAKQEDELNACWNSVYRKIFGFSKWESVRCFIGGLGRLDFHSILKSRRVTFYGHLLKCKTSLLPRVFWYFLKLYAEKDDILYFIGSDRPCAYLKTDIYTRFNNRT